jgi:hypothetical protein
MAKFEVRRPLTTREPTVVVDGGLPVGVHRFELIVVNAAGVKSAPDQVLVQIQAVTPLSPVSPLTPVSPVSPLTPVSPVAPVIPTRPRTPRTPRK